MASGLSHPYLPPPTTTTTTTTAKTNSSFSLSKRSCYIPRAVATIPTSESYWASIEADVQTYLENAIRIRSPESVFEPMHHLTFSAPRTTASALCVAACELVGGARNQAMAAASALHLMHAAAYAHEHLPLTDRPNRPRPEIQHKYGPNIELLTGDGIIPLGLELVARSMDLEQKNEDRVLRVIVEMSRAIGSQGVVDGQYRELEAEEDIIHDIETVCTKKEGTMLGCGAACGAMLGGGGEEEIERLRKFGVYAGIARGLLRMAKDEDDEDGLILRGKIEELKGLALKELESFRGNDDTALLIATLVH